jgi:gliding motility-associated-like protein
MPACLKNILRVIACLMVLPLTAICQVVPAVPTWVSDMGGPGANTVPTSIKVDAQNNMYVMGSFDGTVDFDPSGGVKNLTTTNTNFDGFIAKYNSSGGLVWAESFGGTGTDQPNGLDLDINGNLTLTGQFDSQLMDANPGAGVFNLTAVGKDAFIIRLDNNGNFLWAKNISGTGTEAGQKIVSDASGNLVAVGQFHSNINVDGANIELKGTTDSYVVKYDAAGNVIWKFSLGILKGDNSIVSAVIDKNNNITIAGYINGTVNFDPLGPAFNVSGSNSVFIAQYSPAGILLWSNVIIATVPNINKLTLAVDAQNNIFIDGVFSSSINFSSGAPLTAKGTQDVFLAKYNSNGVIQFNRSISGAGAAVNNSDMVVGPDNNLYLSGYFSGTVDFDISTAVANVKDHGTQDIFLAKYDTNGNYKWAFGMGNSCYNDLARAVAVDTNNDILLSGTFCSNVNFDASACTSAPNGAQGLRDMFVAKYKETTVLDNNIITAPATTNFCTAAGNPDLMTGSTPTGGIGTYKYQWQVNNDPILGFVDIAGATNKDYDPPVPITANSSYRRIVSTSTCTPTLASNIIQFNVQAATLAGNTITAPTVNSFCNSFDPGLITGNLPTGGNGTYTYQWQSSYNNVTFTDITSNGTGPDYDPPLSGGTVYYRRMVTSSDCTVPGGSNVITITVVQPLSNSTIKAPLITTFCDAADPGIIVGDVPTGGDGNITYTWSSSETNMFTQIAGATDKDYDPPLLTKTTHFFRTAYNSCGAPINGNQVDIVIGQGTPVTNNTISQLNPDGTLCVSDANPSNISGSSPSGGQGTYSYQWQRSTDNATFTDIANATNPDYDPLAITVTTYYRRGVISGNASCAVSVYSNVITVNVATSIPIANNVIAQGVANGIFCNAGEDPAIIEGGVLPGSGPYSYQWQMSTDGSFFYNVITGGANGIDYHPQVLTRTTYFRRVVTGGDCTVPSTSNVAMFILTAPVPVNTITTPAVVQNFCDPADPALISGSPATSAGFIQWQQSTDNVTFTTITGATALSYDPPYIYVTTHFRRILNFGTCAPPLTSNVITITINTVGPITNNVVAQPVPDAPACTEGTKDPSIIKGTVAAGPGPFTYQWQFSTDNITFHDTGGTTGIGLDYDPPLISKTGYFRRVVTGSGCSVPSISNVVVSSVTPLPVTTITAPAVTSFCGQADPDVISASPLPGSGYIVQWQMSTDNFSFTDIPNATDPNYDPPVITATTYYRRTVSAPGCSVSPPSNVITINVAQVAVISNNSIAQPVPDAVFCSGSGDPSIMNGTTPTGGSYTYKWQKSTDNVTFSDITGATFINYDPTLISTTTHYRRLVINGCSTLISNVVTILVAPGVANNIITTQSASYCGPSLVGDITGYLLGSGTTYQWQQSADNINFSDIQGANGVLYNPGVVKTTTYYRRVVPGGACGMPSPSNSISISIGAGTFAKVAPVPSICAGNSVTLSGSGGIIYSWSPATGLSATEIATPVATPLVTTKYKLTVYNGNCTDTASVTIIVTPKPNIDAGEDKIILKGDKVKLAGKVTGSNVQYSWSPITYLDDPAILNPTVTPTENITYTLTATSSDGCFIETDKVTVRVYEKVVVPNTFTPNGDGMNDTWDIAAISGYPGSVITVYNREGLPVFKSTDYTKAWDGTVKGKLMPFGTYYYVIDLKNGTKPISGWVAIVK